MLNTVEGEWGAGEFEEIIPSQEKDFATITP